MLPAIQRIEARVPNNFMKLLHLPRLHEFAAHCSANFGSPGQAAPEPRELIFDIPNPLDFNQRIANESESPPLRSPDSIPEWAHAINQAINWQTANAIHFGRLVYNARISLRFGGWTELFRSKLLPFGKTTGEKWSLIGEVCWLLAQDPGHLGKWPVQFEALHEIARLGPELVLQLLGDGTIHSGLKYDAATALVAAYRPDLTAQPPPFNLRRLLAKMLSIILSIIERGSDADLDTTEAELLQLADLIMAERIRRQQRKELKNRNFSPQQSEANEESADQDKAA